MRDRLVDLKGAQNSSMNIPIVYRRTFGWDTNSVLFQPISKRAFVVTKGDLEAEELDPSGYVSKELTLAEIPNYLKFREKKEKLARNELKTALTSISLTDRYVNIDVERPKNKELDSFLRNDLEELSNQLGYLYSVRSGAYRCTFIFPKYTNEQIVMKSVQALGSALGSIEETGEVVKGLKKREKAGPIMADLAYSVGTQRQNMKRYFTEGLNILWDLPQTEPAGHFLIVQSCERVFEEIESLISTSQEVAELLEGSKDQNAEFLWNLMMTLWQTTLKRSLEFLGEALGTIEDPDSHEKCLELILAQQTQRAKRAQEELEYVAGLTKSFDSDRGYKPLVDTKHLQVLHHLFGMHQASFRIVEVSAIIPITVVYLRNSRVEI